MIRGMNSTDLFYLNLYFILKNVKKEPKLVGQHVSSNINLINTFKTPTNELINLK
jgi:hypothetical protein